MAARNRGRAALLRRCEQELCLCALHECRPEGGARYLGLLSRAEEIKPWRGISLRVPHRYAERPGDLAAVDGARRAAGETAALQGRKCGLWHRRRPGQSSLQGVD